MFVCLLTYHREIDREGPLFAAHKAFVAENAEARRFLCSGPRVGVAGGAIVAYGDDEAAARALFDSDPFVVDGTATYELHQFTVGMVDPASGLA
ncbi:hypothetical protein GCM10009836_59170 [Pseudonocardia ailaonensis]|uniref:YCII-related domain-containing protein n=1 Tax=Pseudonocardia ailaonensis TaxID=367279 RepID=A0ABN2NJI4_9PSEU